MNVQDLEKKVEEQTEQIKELKSILNVQNSVFEENITLKEKVLNFNKEIHELKEIIEQLI